MSWLEALASAANHRDTAGAHDFPDPIVFQKTDQRVDPILPPCDLDHHRVGNSAIKWIVDPIAISKYSEVDFDHLPHARTLPI